METPRKPLNKYWCSVPHYLSDIRNIYIKTDRFPLMMLSMNLIHPLAWDVKDTLLARKRQLTADSDSNSLLGVLLLVCHKAKQYLPSPI
jgi:hypothetical protein